MSRRRIIGVILCLTLIAASCGGDAEDAGDASEPAGAGTEAAESLVEEAEVGGQTSTNDDTPGSTDSVATLPDPDEDDTYASVTSEIDDEDPDDAGSDDEDADDGDPEDDAIDIDLVFPLTLHVSTQLPGTSDGGGTDGVEVLVETQRDIDAGSLTGASDWDPENDDIEFPGYLGRWDIDLNDVGITFSNIADEEPTPGYFRVIEADSFDRYYLRIEGLPLAAITPVADSEFVEVDIVGERIIVTLGEGYDTAGEGFTITMN